MSARVRNIDNTNATEGRYPEPSGGLEPLANRTNRRARLRTREAALKRLDAYKSSVTPEQMAFVVQDAGPTFSGDLSKKRSVFR